MTTMLENVVLNRLENLKTGHVAVMWDRLVVRVGNQFNVSDKDATSVSIRKTPYTIEQAEQMIRAR